MKYLILLFILTNSLFVESQNTTKSLKAVSIVENRVHELDGGNIIVLGKSRVVIPIVLPENTIEWYYVFSSYSNSEVVEAKSSQINLVSQLTKIIDKTGTTAGALSYLLAPSGSSASNVYLLEDYENARNFENKTEYDLISTYWYIKPDYSIKTARQGKQKVDLTGDKKYYLGIQAGNSPVVVKIEVVAIVDESVELSNGWTTAMKTKVKDLMKKTFVANKVPEEVADPLSDCILKSIIKEYPQDIFLSLEEQAMNSLLERYAKDCYSGEIKGEETDEQKKAAYYGNLGWNYYENGDLENAVIYSNKALDLQKDLAYVQANLGLFYLLKGDDLQANEYYADAIINLKKDKALGKSTLKAAIEDIKAAQAKFKTAGYKTVLDQLDYEYKNW